MKPRRIVLPLLALLGAFALLLTDYLRFIARPLNLPEHGLTITIEAGDSLYHTARSLEERGVLDSPFHFIALARLSGRAHRIQTGEYRMEPGLTPDGLLDLWVEGHVVQYAFTIVEGWRYADLMAALRAAPALRQTLNSQDDAAVIEALALKTPSLEGQFLPDTYHFPRGTSDVEFLRRASRALQSRLQAEWEKRDAGLPYRTPYEALILASLVEKETAKPEEMRRIAGVFVRRLRQGMLLQTDPSVIYGMGARYTGNLRREDLLADTPYNTYTRAGLPPTPIALPGKGALNAALHPLHDDSLYFVARGDGTHEFSATLDAHNQAVRKYQLHGRSQGASP